MNEETSVTINEDGTYSIDPRVMVSLLKGEIAQLSDQNRELKILNSMLVGALREREGAAEDVDVEDATVEA